jgi:predicted PolB exonuclease-like 3'-5' exonuclease
MKTITLDLETVLDEEAAERCHYHKNPDEFAPWILHRPVCVSMLTIERTDWDRVAFSIHSLTRGDASERGMIDEVEQYLSDADQIITFNGHGFDAPVLRARAAVNQIEAPTILQMGLRSRLNFHLDLLDVVTANGSAPRIKLAELCAPFRIPVKLQAGGDGVADLAATNDWQAIQHYCETDVVSTWLASQMWLSAKDAEFGRTRWSLLADWVLEDQPRLAHLRPYASLPSARRLGPWDDMDIRL